MSIFIFEDDIIQAERLREIVEEICEQYQLPYDFIEVTSKYEEIIEKIPQTHYVPIYFLDIEIKGQQRRGLEVAQEIRKYDSQGMIVFVTTHANFAPISYQYMVSALAFIDKNLPHEEHHQLIEKCLLHYEARNRTSIPTDDFIVDNQHATVRVPFEKVVYIMTDGPHRLVLVTTNQRIHFYGTLKEIEKIDQRLLRCHQSYIVNTEQISAYDAAGKNIIFKNKEQVRVSRRLVRKVRQLVKGEL